MSSRSDPETTQTLTVCGRKIYVSVRPGDGSRTPLLLMNGIGTALEAMQPFVDALDPSWEVIRFDVPGTGRSPAPRLPYTLATMSLVTARMLDQLGHTGRVDVMGFSWGGGLAQHFAVQHFRRCRRLVLAATGTGTLMVPAHPRVLMRMATPRRHRDPGYAARIAATIYGGSIRHDPRPAHKIRDHVAPLGPQRGYYYQLLAAAGWTSLPFLKLIRQPTLVICGDDDPIVPKINAKIMGRLIPNAQVHVYPGGHLGLLTEAEELVPIIERFLSRTG
jgi:poly(3-hydroxyalkanoate) depolymerase